ncbi:DUF1592 domain-containing protein [Verrucomicrobiaceae bacterium 227]
MITLRTALAALLFSQPLLAENPKAILPQRHFDIIENYCLDCHDSATEKGKINLEELSFEISKDIATAERWQKVLNAINTGEMPPKKKDQLTAEEKTALLGDLSVQMVTARRVLADTGGVITLRRLNRREYENTLEVLLGVRPDASDLPPDQINPGFDTAGASLFFSSDQLEQYLATARKTLELSLSPITTRPSRTVRVEPEEYYTPHYTASAASMQDKSDRAKAFLAQTEKPASDFGILDAYQARKQLVPEWLPLMKDYLNRPETKTGATFIMTIKEGGPTKVKIPTLHEKSEGKYLIRLRAAAYAEADERFHYLEFTSGLGTGRERLGWRKVTGTLENPQIIEFPIEHRPGVKTQIWIHQRTHQDRGDKNLTTLHMKQNGIGTTPGIWVDWAELEGPLPVDHRAEAASKILFEKPTDLDDAAYAREVLSRFATRAFRGAEVSAEYLDRLCQHYADNLAKGQKPVEALISPLSIILSSPGFLYMVESTGNVNTTQLTGTELAVRLSYFLWSSPPDDELMSVAKSGTLNDPAVLEKQINRLLADERSFQFVRDFTYQWLEIGRLDTFQFNGLKFPTFDNAARDNAREEVFQTVRTLLTEKLPLGTLLKSDFVVINDLLAGYYEIPGVEGHHFRKVTLPAGHIRGGLLGSAAVLAMGSDGERSSPVERGAWVLRHLINRPPPPAPPNVPMLSRFDGKVLPARELQRAHQEEPQCAQCHEKIDPIGFGLENFDADGRWRATEFIALGKAKGIKAAAAKGKTFPIDPSGKLPGDIKFADYLGLRDAIAEHDEAFARSFAEALITYGLGRPFGFIDQDLADAMLEHARPGNYDLNLFIHALIQSKPFQTK